MSKIMDYLLEEAEQKFDGDFEAAQEHLEIKFIEPLYLETLN